MKVIVGSTAVHHNLGEGKFREPKDLDIWCSESSYKDMTLVKGIDVKIVPDKILNLMETSNGYASMDTLYTIKYSHLGWDNPMWDKHKQDLLYLKKLGCKVIPLLLEELLSFWKGELGNKDFLSLGKSKEDFFTDGVVYKYDHDWLHEQVAYPREPVYKKCLKQGQDVLIDKTKFDTLPLEEQVRMFREEVTVIAIERFIVNPKLKREFSWVQSYIMALRKTITNLTKGWSTLFIIENLDKMVVPDYSYFEHTLKLLNKEEN